MWSNCLIEAIKSVKKYGGVMYIIIPKYSIIPFPHFIWKLNSDLHNFMHFIYDTEPSEFSILPSILYKGHVEIISSKILERHKLIHIYTSRKNHV